MRIVRVPNMRLPNVRMRITAAACKITTYPAAIAYVLLYDVSMRKGRR